MADIINLNRVRKQKARAAAAAQADVNRVKFGRSKEQKTLDAAVEAEARRKLDALRRDRDEEDQPA
jgi:hypothetical protein